MITITRTNSENPDFVTLVRLLDADLAAKNGDQNAFYSQYNKIALIKHALVAYADERAVACGAIKEFEPGVMEVKRMFTRPDQRGRGIASQVLAELERWAAELGYNKCILETGRQMTEAVRLYQKSGYIVIPNYGQYAEVENSICFEKLL
jgi:GNAT superfamily N-acetyltransferase